MEGSHNSTLKLSVLDETDSRPELIGDTVIQLAPAYSSNPTEGFDKWHELIYKGKYAGEVYLEMTFYPAQPPARRGKRSSASKSRNNSLASLAASTYSEFSNSMSFSLNNDDMTGSLNYSVSMMSSVSSRPLPSSPMSASTSTTPSPSPSPLSSTSTSPAPDASLMNSSYSRRESMANSLCTVRVGGVNSPHCSSSPLPPALYASSSNTNEFGFPTIPELPPMAPPHRGSVSENSPDYLNMSTLSRSLPNPMDYQIAHDIDLPAIPPETPQHLSSSVQSNSTVSTTIINKKFSKSSANGEAPMYDDNCYNDDNDDDTYSEEEFTKFFSTPIPDTLETTQKTAFNSHHYSQRPHSPFKSSPLSQSTSSDRSVETIHPLTPTVPGAVDYSELSSSVMSKSLPLTPSRNNSNGSILSPPRTPDMNVTPAYNNSSIEAGTTDPLRTSGGRRSIKRKPIQSGSKAPGSPHILPYPGAKHSVDPTADEFDDDSDIKNVPFSADSYFSKKTSFNQMSSGGGGMTPNGSNGAPPPSPPKEHQSRFSSPIKKKQPNSTPSLSLSTNNNNNITLPALDHINTYPPSPPMKSAGSSKGNTNKNNGGSSSSPYMEDGQWNLSNELNSGYADDVYDEVTGHRSGFKSPSSPAQNQNQNQNQKLLTKLRGGRELNLGGRGGFQPNHQQQQHQQSQESYSSQDLYHEDSYYPSDNAINYDYDI